MARHALLIGVSEFADERLSRLNAPTNDVIALRRLLQEEARGGFANVDLSLNEDFLTIRDRLSRFYRDKAPDDLVLLYYSGHGILGRGNRLFLAATGSNVDAPRERSISAAEIREWMEECRAEKQVVLLDCCHSGAFAEQAKSGVATPAVTADTFATGDAGIYVLTAADALQFAWDGEDLLSGDASAIQTSQFTGWLVDAIEGGEAAPDEEQITMDALYRYLFRRARKEGAASTPQRFVRGGVGDPVISRNPLAGANQVDAALQAALAAKDDYRLRLGAVAELRQQMRGTDEAAARGARLLLARHLQLERDFLVRQTITEALDAVPRSLDAKAEPPPPLTTLATQPKPSTPDPSTPTDPVTTVTVKDLNSQLPGPPETWWKKRRYISLPIVAVLFVIAVLATYRPHRPLPENGTWQPQISGTSVRLYSVQFTADGLRGWAVGAAGTILATKNGGETWQPQTSGTTNSLSSVQFAADGLRGWAVSWGGTILATKNGGETWQPQTISGTTGGLNSVQFTADGQRGWAVGYRGTVLATKNGGETWQRQISAAINDLNSVQFVADGLRGWAVGYDGAFILATKNGGETWQEQWSGTTKSLKSIQFAADGLRGWAVGADGTILATKNGGEAWEAQTSGTTKWLHSIQFAADGLRGWAVGEDGMILATKNGGETWQRQTSGTTEDLYSVQFAADGHRGWAVGADGTILATQVP